ncbi:hypothetical protein AB4Z55_23940 [Gordonia sp. ABKF26]|uniref:hypothetical protein n=1 Tax=Gordonia sp. ABKF26 TaxID=3238687 RepID=UPI0034E5AB5E
MADITYMTVTGLWTHIVDDGIVDGDPNPDTVRPTGKVVFAPKPSNTGFVTAGAAGESESVTLAEVPALVADGVLTDLQGNDGIRLAATIGGNPVRWVAQPTLLYGKKTLPSKSVTFDPPTVGTTLHLNDLFDDIGPQSPLVTTEVKAYRDQAVAARDEAQQIVDDVAAGVVPDAGVAARIAAPDSESGAAVDARIGAAGLLTQEDADAAYAPTVDTRVPAANLPEVYRTTDSQPFAADSIWNTARGDGCTFESAADPATANLLTATPVLNDFTNGYGFNIDVASPTDPLGTGTYPGGSFTHRMPRNARIATGTDASMRIIDGIYAYDYWHTTKVDDVTYTADFITRTDLRGSGRNAGTRAARFPTAGGLIRTHEVAKGHIPHALCMSIPLSCLKRGFVWPAAAEDANDGAHVYSGQVPMGSFFSIPTSVNVSTLGLSPEGLALARSLQDYGVYIGDASGSAALSVEGEAMRLIPAAVDRMRADWTALFPMLRRVTNVGTVGGGPGARRAPATGPVAVKSDVVDVQVSALRRSFELSGGDLITSASFRLTGSSVLDTTDCLYGGVPKAWSGFVSECEISNGALRRIASNDGVARAVILDHGAKDARVEILVTARQASGTTYVLARSADSQNTYRAAFTSTGTASLQKVVGGGSGISLPNSSTAAGVVKAGTKFGIGVFGTTIVLLIDGQVAATAVDASLQTGAKSGLLLPADTTLAIGALWVNSIPQIGA